MPPMTNEEVYRVLHDGVQKAIEGATGPEQFLALNQRVVVPILEASHNAPWDSVDIQARVVDADPGGPLYDAANKLYEHFTWISPVGNPIASKLSGVDPVCRTGWLC